MLTSVTISLAAAAWLSIFNLNPKTISLKMNQTLIPILHGLLAPFAAIGFIFAVVGGMWWWMLPFGLFVLISLYIRL